eukprot:gene29417-biopygen5344
MKDKEGFIPSDQRLLGAVNVAAFLLIITATLLSLGYLEFASPQPEGQTATEARRWGLSGNTDHSKAYGHVVKNIADHSLIEEALEYQRTGIPLHQYLDHLRELQRSELEISTDLDALNWEEADTIETFFKRGKLLYSEMRSAHSGAMNEYSFLTRMLSKLPSHFDTSVHTISGSGTLTGVQLSLERAILFLKQSEVHQKLSVKRKAGHISTPSKSARTGDAGPSGSGINMTSIDPSSLAMFVSDAVRNEVQQSLQSFRARNGNKGGNSGGTSSVNRGGYGNGNRGGSGNRNGNQSGNENRGYGGRTREWARSRSQFIRPQFLQHLERFHQEATAGSSRAAAGTTWQQWHARLGHVGITTLQKMIQNNVATGMAVLGDVMGKCMSFTLGKFKKSPYPLQSPPDGPLDLLYSDVCGPLPCGLNGHKYFVTVRDRFSGYSMVKTVHEKKEAATFIIQCIESLERGTTFTVKAIRLDRGGEYTSTSLLSYLSSKGIIAQHTATECSASNGTAERLNLTIMDRHEEPKADLWATSQAAPACIRKVITARHCELLEEDNQIPRIPDASDPGPACKKCNSKDEVYPSRILLCDCIGCSHCKPNAGSETSTCDAAWHMACLPDPLFKLPRRNWLCPDCTKTPETQPGQVSSLETLEPFLEDPDPILLPDPPATNATNVSKRGRVRRSPVVYNPVFLSMMVLDDMVTSTVAGTSAAGVPPDPSSLSEAMEMDGLTLQFLRKVDAFGNFVKYKARLVAKGFLQKFGVDFTDVFSPATKLATLRVLLSHVAALDLELRHVDVRTAFLNGDLAEEVYIAVPEGLHDMYPDKCFKLDKAIYGLKQAPRVWWLNLSSTLAKHGFKPTFADQCLFIKQGAKGLVYCLVYVDDILFAGHADDVQDAVNIILNAYDATDEGQARYFLGMAITRDRANRTLTLSQLAYVKDMAKKFGFDSEYPNKKVSIPISTDNPEPGAPLSQKDAGDFASLIGSLLYLANCTRPDISYAVGIMARHMRTPHFAHLKSAKHMLKYCIVTHDLGLIFGSDVSSVLMNVVGYTDSDYANVKLPVVDETVTRRSTSGFVFMSNGTPVAWQSKRQPVVARSSDDAEYIAMANAASTGLWLRKLYGEMSGSVFQCMTIFGDNTATLKHIKDPGSINRSKHIDIAFQFVLDRAIRHDLKFIYVASSENTADVFTKALTFSVFSYLRNKLGLQQIK